MDKETIIKHIFFNILTISLILLIYFMFFPKKSYIDSKLKEKLDKNYNEIFKQNIKMIEISANDYFSNNEETKVTIEKLQEEQLLTEIKEDNNICDKNSYIEKTNNGILINLKCNEKEEKIEIKQESKKILCLYEYTKEKEAAYSNWSEFSEWSTEKKENNELTNVESKIERIKDGTTNEQITEEIPATKKTRLACPSGYKEHDNECIKETLTNTIKASISYSCPSGYSKNGVNCYKNNDVISATKKYFCPSDKDNIHFKLENDKCIVINIKHYKTETKEEYYTCPNNYKLSNNKCYINIEKEIDKYKEITYYRYQTRTKENKKFDIIWSNKNDTNLINNEYIMGRKIFCDF